ncbi:hypothetical protein AAVH_32790 [Aphelenchoides avenae]|nr:hypothetical protein AAVH_32790 [Aphelenchus avenae]
MGWDKRREAGDAAEKIADDVIGFFEGVKDSYIEAKEATEGTEQRPSEKMLTSGNFYVTAGKSAVTLGAHAIRTVKKFSEAAKLEKAGKDVAAEFAKREAARSFKTGGVEIDRVDTALGVVTIAKAVCDDVKNDSCLETLKAGGSLVADLASQTMKKPCSLLGGKNLCVMGKWNSLTLKTSNDFKLAKLNTVTTAVGAVQAVWNSYKEGSAEPLVDFVGSTTGNVVGQMVGRSVGGAIGSLFGPLGTAIGAGIGGALGGFLGEKVWHRVRRGRVEKRPKKTWRWPWF